MILYSHSIMYSNYIISFRPVILANSGFSLRKKFLDYVPVISDSSTFDPSFHHDSRICI